MRDQEIRLPFPLYDGGEVTTALSGIRWGKQSPDGLPPDRMLVPEGTTVRCRPLGRYVAVCVAKAEYLTDAAAWLKM